ncbi:hypothetical protein Dimus_034219, partial [Dionaea muscipula]
GEGQKAELLARRPSSPPPLEIKKPSIRRRMQQPMQGSLRPSRGSPSTAATRGPEQRKARGEVAHRAPTFAKHGDRCRAQLHAEHPPSPSSYLNRPSSRRSNMEVDAELVAKIPSSFMAELRIVEYKEEVEHDEDPRSVAGQDPPEHHNELKKNQAMEVAELGT